MKATMRKVVCMVVLVAVMVGGVSVDAQAAVKYKTYSNKRFTYSVKYPTKVIKTSEYSTQEGAKFSSKDGKVSVEMWNTYGKSNSRNGRTVVATAKKSRKIKVIKSTEKEGSYSYNEGKKVVRYYYYYLSNGVIAFRISYPKSQKKYYAKAINGMIKSVKKNKKLTLKGE